MDILKNQKITSKVSQNLRILLASSHKMDTKKEDSIVPARQNDENESVADGKVDKVVEDIVHAAEEEFSPEQYRKLLGKVDRIILPMMWVGHSKNSRTSTVHFTTYCNADNNKNEDLFWCPVCGQSLCLDTSYVRSNHGYSSCRTAVFV